MGSGVSEVHPELKISEQELSKRWVERTELKLKHSGRVKKRKTRQRRRR